VIKQYQERDEVIKQYQERDEMITKSITTIKETNKLMKLIIEEVEVDLNKK